MCQYRVIVVNISEVGESDFKGFLELFGVSAGGHYIVELDELQNFGQLDGCYGRNHVSF